MRLALQLSGVRAIVQAIAFVLPTRAGRAFSLQRQQAQAVVPGVAFFLSTRAASRSTACPYGLPLHCHPPAVMRLLLLRSPTSQKKLDVNDSRGVAYHVLDGMPLAPSTYGYAGKIFRDCRRLLISMEQLFYLPPCIVLDRYFGNYGTIRDIVHSQSHSSNNTFISHGTTCEGSQINSESGP
ncbi:unnamed protein product [Miscanthus lutarioriparius]|uniref:Uncharacterized protein n=1 Tax=Miscanthus lutarioriparius TaxID=422564 RepID=A0A811PMX7_9POAL|nr:unnamed protein product [Miscanthus lutarioriparius]